MNAASEAKMDLISPALAATVRSVARALALRSLFICVASGLRTAAEQNALYAQGRGAPGHVVTNAKAGQSMHNYGLAVDVVPFIDSTQTALNWKVNTPQYQVMVAEFKHQGLEWGGDWKGSLGDFDHFQLGKLPASPSEAMWADYNAKREPTDFTQIWYKASNGLYAPATA